MFYVCVLLFFFICHELRISLTLLMSRFCGLRSRCRTLRLWQNASPFSSWYMNDCGTTHNCYPNAHSVVYDVTLKRARTLTISGSRSPLQLSKYFFRSCRMKKNTKQSVFYYFSHNYIKLSLSESYLIAVFEHQGQLFIAVQDIV